MLGKIEGRRRRGRQRMRWLDGITNSGHAAAAAVKSLQLCPTLRDPMDCSLPGSSVHGIFQARVLGWVAIAFSNYTWHSGVITPVAFGLYVVIKAQFWKVR